MAFHDDYVRRAVFIKIKEVNGGEGRYVRAPFDLVRIGVEWGVEPHCGPGSELDKYVKQTFAIEPDRSLDEYFVLREEGYHDLKIVVVEPQELGTGFEGPDNWQSLHSLGMF